MSAPTSWPLEAIGEGPLPHEAFQLGRRPHGSRFSQRPRNGESRHAALEHPAPPAVPLSRGAWAALVDQRQNTFRHCNGLPLPLALLPPPSMTTGIASIPRSPL